MEELLRKQQSNFRAFKRTVTNINLDSVSEKWEYEDLLKTLQTRWNVIDSLHWELDSVLEGSDTQYEKAYTSNESTYNQVKKDINKKLWSVAHREISTPQMDIPEFSGNYHQWVSFKDLFTEAIRKNPSISNAQKMQFLKCKIRGEAERLIQHLSISTDNYMVCWDILNHRFNNQKLIFNSHINTILNLQTMQQPSGNHIKKIHDTTLECLNAIKNLGVDISTWDPILVHLLSQKLDTQTFSEYMESQKHPRELPELKSFLEFLENKFMILESARRKQDGVNQPLQKSSFASNQHQYNQKPGNKQFLSNQVATNQKPKLNKELCLLCNKEAHGIYFCKTFLGMQPYLRRKIVTKFNLCLNCLQMHDTNTCISTKCCQECNGRHNTLLHDVFNKVTGSNMTPTPTAARGASPAADHESGSTHVSQQRDVPEILLATAIIKVQGFDGNYYNMRALIDQGSQLSLITEKAAQHLNLPRYKSKGVISGVGIKESSSKGQIKINCKSLDETYFFNAEVRVMKNLIRNLPNSSFEKPSWGFLKNITLADPDFHVSRPVDILLGAEVYSQIMLEGICRSSSVSPIAQQTRLGWILCGSVNTLLCNVVLHDMNQIEKFWEIEDISEQSDLSSEDVQCLKFYQETTVRHEDGKYEVRLPLKANFKEQLGASQSKATAQFLQLERKFKKNENMCTEYKQFINEYITLRHMIPSTKSNANTATGASKPECYLPHHCVLRDDSSTTALRVVYNASSPTSSGKSLNDLMARGPNLQQDLQSLILKWRQYKFAFTADIEKMFRQIWVHTDDRKLQKIIWREHFTRI